MQGEVVGVVVAKLDAAKVLKWTGDLPENVNYAMKVAYLQPLLASSTPIRKPKVLRPAGGDLVAIAERVRESIVLVAAE